MYTCSFHPSDYRVSPICLRIETVPCSSSVGHLEMTFAAVCKRCVLRRLLHCPVSCPLLFLSISIVRLAPQAPRGLRGGAADGRQRCHRGFSLVPPLHGQASQGEALKMYQSRNGENLLRNELSKREKNIIKIETINDMNRDDDDECRRSEQ